MKYELWCGNALLGCSDLGFPHISTTTFAGEFEPAPGTDGKVERLAVATTCMSAWMNRDTIDAHGQPVIRPGFRNSRLFSAITEAIASRHDPALQLRRPDGTVVRTRHLVIQDMETLPEELSDEAWRGNVHADESIEDDEFVFDPGVIGSRPRFNLHVMIEHAGDIPADTSWLTG